MSRSFEDKATRLDLRRFRSLRFHYLSGYVEFWLRFIRVKEVVTPTLEHTWDGRYYALRFLKGPAAIRLSDRREWNRLSDFF